MDNSEKKSQPTVLESFKVSGGQLEFEGPEENRSFISDNMDFVHPSLQELRNNLGVESEISLICCEDEWGTALRISDEKDGQITEAKGIFILGQNYAIDTLRNSIV